MGEPAKILNLASALAALVAPTPAAPPIANAADPDGAQLAAATNEEIEAKAETDVSHDAELMSFTVHQSSDGMLFPQHQSHSSHASHVSHASSSIPGTWGVPDAPNLPNLPNPVYPAPAPVPVPAPAPVPALTGPPASGSDPAALACARAANGLGVNQIAGELQQVYGLDTNGAVSIAQQALAAVLAGGHFCDAYLGGG
ncbi:hypothetical protein [Mycobacterium sp. MMS18-G62]